MERIKNAGLRSVGWGLVLVFALLLVSRVEDLRTEQAARFETLEERLGAAEQQLERIEEFLLRITYEPPAPDSQLASVEADVIAGSPEPVERPPQEQVPRDAEARVHAEGEFVSVGYTSYQVHESTWMDRLSRGQFTNKRADAHWLVLVVSVRNDDSQPRSLPPFKLFDERGREYATSSYADFAVPRALTSLDDLNPGIEKKGLVVFDVPQHQQYQLEVSGGFWSGESARIALVPTNAPQAPSAAVPPAEEPPK